MKTTTTRPVRIYNDSEPGDIDDDVMLRFQGPVLVNRSAIGRVSLGFLLPAGSSEPFFSLSLPDDEAVEMAERILRAVWGRQNDYPRPARRKASPQP